MAGSLVGLQRNVTLPGATDAEQAGAGIVESPVLTPIIDSNADRKLEGFHGLAFLQAIFPLDHLFRWAISFVGPAGITPLWRLELLPPDDTPIMALC